MNFLLKLILTFLKSIYNFLFDIFIKVNLFFIKTLSLSQFPDIDNAKNESLLIKIEDFIEDFLEGNIYSYN